MPPALSAEQASLESCHDVQTHIKRLQEPDDDGCGKDDRKGTLEEILRFFPEQLTDILCARHAVIRQLHDEGNGFAGEDGFAHQQGVENAHQDAQHIKPSHDPHGVLREEHGTKNA